MKKLKENCLKFIQKLLYGYFKNPKIFLKKKEKIIYLVH